jgi:hypothetical protein
MDALLATKSAHISRRNASGASKFAMTTPRGFLKSISTAFMRLARKGDVDGLRSYIRSDDFLHAFNGLDPARRQSVMRTHTVAEDMCEARARRRLVEPKPIYAKRAQKADWGDPAMLAKLANAYLRAGGDDERAARILGVTVGSSRLAKRRHLKPPAANSARKPPSGP